MLQSGAPSVVAECPPVEHVATPIVHPPDVAIYGCVEAPTGAEYNVPWVESDYCY